MQSASSYDGIPYFSQGLSWGLSRSGSLSCEPGCNTFGRKASVSKWEKVKLIIRALIWQRKRFSASVLIITAWLMNNFQGQQSSLNPHYSKHHLLAVGHVVKSQRMSTDWWNDKIKPIWKTLVPLPSPPWRQRAPNVSEVTVNASGICVTEGSQTCRTLNGWWVIARSATVLALNWKLIVWVTGLIRAVLNLWENL